MDLSFAEFAISSLKLNRIYIVLGKKIDAMKNLHNEPRPLEIMKIGQSEK